MATFSGKDGAVYSGNTAVAEVRDWSVEQTANRVDDTAMGASWTSGKITQKAWTGSVNIYFSPTQTGLDLGDEITLNLYPQGKTTGLKYYSGKAHITSKSVTASFDGMIEASIGVDGNGQLSFLTAS
jgi:hypothetical protein